MPLSDDDNNEDVDDTDDDDTGDDDSDDDDDEDEDELLILIMVVVVVVLINRCRCTQRYILVILIFGVMVIIRFTILSKAKTVTSGRGDISLGQRERGTCSGCLGCGHAGLSYKGVFFNKVQD